MAIGTLAEVVFGCGGTACRGSYRLFTTDGFVSFARITSLALFPIAYFGMKTKWVVVRFLSMVHFYACLLAPGMLGGQGFGWAAPYLLSAGFGLADSGSMPVVSLYFFTTWLVLFSLVAGGWMLTGRLDDLDLPARE